MAFSCADPGPPHCDSRSATAAPRYQGHAGRRFGALLLVLVATAGCSDDTPEHQAADAAPPITTIPVVTSATTTPAAATTPATPMTPTSTVTTMAIPRTTSTLHPVVQSIAGSWRARSPNPRVDGWADLHITEEGLFRFTNPQSNDVLLATGRFVFDDETLTVYLGQFVWPNCDGGGVFTWKLVDPDTLRFSLIEDECPFFAETMTSHPWYRRG